MPPKTRLLRAIDRRALGTNITSGAAGASASASVVPPAQTSISEPLNLALTTAIGYSSAAPTAVINATWDAPYDAVPQFYQVNVSTGSSFTANGTILAQANTESAHIESLLPNTLYYVRVRAWAGGVAGAWSDVVSITTASDTTPSGPPTGISATWIGVGDLLVTWTNPTSANFKDVEIKVRASSGGTIYRTTSSAAGRFLYTLAMNRQDTAGVGDPSLYIELTSRSFSNVLGTTQNTGLVTKSAPATPSGVTHSWSGDTGAAGPDLTFAWAPANDASSYRLTLDGVASYLAGATATYTYTLDANRAAHSGAPDPAVAYSLVAVDGFGQVSTTVSGTATNVAPAAPTATLSQGAVSGLYAIVTSAPPADFWRYEYTWKRDGATVATVYSASSTQRYEQQGTGDEGYHSWTVVIRQQDLFGQFSPAVTPAAVVFEALTLAGLRAMAAYTDSDGNTTGTLAALKDGVTSGGGVSYAA